MCQEYCGNLPDRLRPQADLQPLQEPTATSTNVTMEMIIGSVEKNDDGSVKIHRFVKFSTGNGHHILYPWEGVKETVLSWIEIEKSA